MESFIGYFAARCFDRAVSLVTEDDRVACRRKETSIHRRPTSRAALEGAMHRSRSSEASDSFSVAVRAKVDQ